MSIVNFLKQTFLQPQTAETPDLVPEAVLNINFKILVVEFADNVESNCGETLAQVLKTKEGISVYYFTESFNKSFLNLESRTLFDLIDKGQDIIDKSGADVLIWGYREGEKIRLNFQTNLQYEKQDCAFTSLLDSLYLPASIFENSNTFPSSISNLVYGAAISSLNTPAKTRKIQKRYLLKKIINKLSADNSAKSLSIEYLPYIMNFLGIIYLSYCADQEQEKDFKIVKNLFDTALKHQDLIKSPIHLGCIYYHLGQLYDSASRKLNKRATPFYKNAINSYRLAQKYLSKYTYPYDYGFISYKLSHLYHDYWKQKEDLQALRDAVFNLREAEKIFTYTQFPELWAAIQGELGHLLSLLGSLTSSEEIAGIAISCYKNQQKVITERRDPLDWATIQENIGDIYCRIGKSNEDKTSLEDSLEYFHDALYIFENMNIEENVKRLTSKIALTERQINNL